MQYVITNNEKFPITFSIPVVHEVKDKQRLLRRDENGGEIVVIEEITREQIKAKSLLLPASIRGQDPGILVVEEDDYHALTQTDFFNNATAPKMRGGLGWCTVSVDSATVRRLAQERRNKLAEDRANRLSMAKNGKGKIGPTAPIVISQDDELDEEPPAPKRVPTTRRNKAADITED